MIKIRIRNYKTAEIIYFILRFIWWKLLKRGIRFDQVNKDESDYERKPIDTYYLIQLE